MELNIQQKKLSIIHTFSFGDEKLNFAFKDKTGSADFDVYYADIPFKTSITIERNEWLRNVGVIWIVLGLIQTFAAIYTQKFSLDSAFWLYIGIFCLIGFYFTKTIYTVFRTDKGNIFVIQGKKHDAILQEIVDRRRKQFLAWYGEINLNNEIENEVNKFKWLQSLNIISEKEAESKIAQIHLSSNQELLLEKKH